MCCEIRSTNPSGLASPLDSRLFSQWGFNRIIGRIEMGPLKLEDIESEFDEQQTSLELPSRISVPV